MCHREVSDVRVCVCVSACVPPAAPPQLTVPTRKTLLTEDGYMDVWVVLTFPTLYHSLLETLLIQLE